MRLIVMYKNEMMDCVEDVEQAHFYEDKVIMNKLPLNITELKLEKVSSINCQDISIEQVKQLQDQIADLEAKLAEYDEYFKSFSCEDFNEFKDFISTFMLTPHEEQALIQQLKQQLAEKDKEIEKWKTKWCESETNSLRLYEQNQNNNQDKISFAIEQLEKVKEVINIYNKEHCFLSTEIDTCNKSVEIIDNQIAEIKKEGK